jgi:hypothetical protein
MLWQVGSRVLEFKESFGNVVGHVEVDGPDRIIPVNVNATKEKAISVHGDGIVFFQSGLEMKDVVDVFFSWATLQYHTGIIHTICNTCIILF